MLDLGEQLKVLSSAPVLWLGLGSTDAGDDAVGIRLAELLQSRNIPTVDTPGLHPEHWIARAQIPQGGHVIFLDAANFDAQPGAVALFDVAQIHARFPQISTHRIALSTLARILLDRGAGGVWLLGIQPASLRLGDALSPAVQFTVELLERLIFRHFGERPAEASPNPGATTPNTGSPTP